MKLIHIKIKDGFGNGNNKLLINPIQFHICFRKTHWDTGFLEAKANRVAAA